MRKTKKQLETELEAANKRNAELVDALVKAVQAQPVYMPYYVPYQPAVNPPVWPWGVTYTFTTDKIDFTAALDAGFKFPINCAGAIPQYTTFEVKS